MAEGLAEVLATEDMLLSKVHFLRPKRAVSGDGDSLEPSDLPVLGDSHCFSLLTVAHDPFAYFRQNSRSLACNST